MGDVPSSPNHLAGKRYVNLVRCSTDAQTETSIPAQLDLLNAFGVARGMIHVDDVKLDGISGPKPGNRDDLKTLIDRKTQQHDFDVLLVQTEDRFTRGGSGHGIWMTYELQSHGIQVVYASSDAPEGRCGRSALFEVKVWGEMENMGFGPGGQGVAALRM